MRPRIVVSSALIIAIAVGSAVVSNGAAGRPEGADSAARPGPSFPFLTLDQAVEAGRVSAGLVAELRENGSATGIVTLRNSDVIVEILNGPEIGQSQEAIEELRSRYSVLKNRLVDLVSSGLEVVDSYDYLPTVLITFTSELALLAVANVPFVEGVSKPVRGRTTLDQSLRLVHADRTAAAGHRGDGVFVAVLDTGTDYGRDAFGACEAPDQPSTCGVYSAREYGMEDGVPDDDTTKHGTNVSAIVLGVAPGARVLALDVFALKDTDGNSIWREEDLISAIDDVMGWRAEGLNIRAMNMSLGWGPSFFTEACATDPRGGPNPFVPLFAQARAVGIIPVVAAGNDGGSQEPGVSYPGCTAGAVSVGAVYDAGGSLEVFGTCIDWSKDPDRITCFSQRGPNLSLFAPGACISAGGVPGDGSCYGGTSQAAPHVAGAVAVLAAARPEATAGQIQRALAGSGPLIARYEGAPKRRLDVEAALATLSALEFDPPTVTEPTHIVADASPGTTTRDVTFTWAGFDEGGSGLVAYGLRLKTDDGRWTPVPLPSRTATGITLSLEVGHRYRLAVRASDGAGNLGPWAFGATFVLPA